MRSLPQPTAEADLTPLFEFSRLVNSSLELPFVLNAVLLTLMARLFLSKSAILLKKQDSCFKIVGVKGLPDSFHEQEIAIPKPIKKRAALTADRFPSLKPLSSEGLSIIIPIRSEDSITGYLCLGKKINKSPISKHEYDYIEAILNISVASIQKAVAFDEIRAINKKLDTKNHELRTLFELSKEYNGVLESQQLIRLFTLSLMGQVGVVSYAICFRDGETVSSRIETEHIKDWKGKLFEIITAPTLAAMFKKKKSLGKLYQFCIDQDIHAFIPLQSRNVTQGLLCLGRKMRGGEFTDSDLEFIYSLGNLAIISLENSRLFFEAVEKEKLENELNIAREIQRGLLPQSLPTLDGYSLAAVSLPSKQVGGDYYDVITREDGTIIIAIGDVSGKGTPASLLMANVQATIRTLSHFSLPISDMTRRVNHLICECTNSGSFITFFWGILDPTSHTLMYVNAGHNPPFLLKQDRSIERLTTGGIILGVMKNVPEYEQCSVAIEKGDTLVCFTDGISEAQDAAGAEFGEERIGTIADSISQKSAEFVLAGIREAVEEFAAGVDQYDDMTLMVIHHHE